MAGHLPNIESLVATFWRTFVVPGIVRRRVTVNVAADGKTWVSVSHRLPPLPFRVAKPSRWRVTNEFNIVLSGQFADDEARAVVDSDGLKERGRALYLVDLMRDEVVAALSFHVDSDNTLPIKIRAVLVRTDGDERWRAFSQAWLSWLFPYVHEVARQSGRPGFLSAEVVAGSASQDRFKTLGFHENDPPPGYTPRGDSYLVLRPRGFRRPLGQR